VEVASKTDVTFVVAKNNALGKAAVNALELLSRFSGKKSKVPDSLCEHYPELKQIADSGGEPNRKTSK
jgi:hypothetical protein